MTLRLRQRWQRQVLRACLPAFAGRDPLLIDARGPVCRVALRAGEVNRWLCVEIVENRASILASVKVALRADELPASYVSHGTSGEPLVQEVLATIDGSRTLRWEGDLDDDRVGAALDASLDAFWSAWCRDQREDGRAATAIALATHRRDVFVEARRNGGLLPSRLTTADHFACAAAHPFVALGVDAAILGATASEALALAEIERVLRATVPGETWPDAVPLAHVVGDA